MDEEKPRDGWTKLLQLADTEGPVHLTKRILDF